MQISASQGKLLLLTSKKRDIAAQCQDINAKRIDLSNRTVGINDQLSNILAPVAPLASCTEAERAQYEAAMAVYESKYQSAYAPLKIMEAEDQSLEMTLKQLESQQDAIQNEMDAVSKANEKKSENKFKTFG